ncbi:MAG: hypothetical protein WC714_18005 [Candidatus Obscuribacterales bacterium]|jgi:hypothetical protein
MLPFGIVGLLFTAIIALGARKVWLSVVHVLSKMFKHEAGIKKAAFCVIFATVMLMAAPFIMPFSPALRLVVWALYLLYAGLGLYQIYDWLPFGKSKDSE